MHDKGHPKREARALAMGARRSNGSYRETLTACAPYAPSEHTKGAEIASKERRATGAMPARVPTPLPRPGKGAQLGWAAKKSRSFLGLIRLLNIARPRLSAS